MPTIKMVAKTRLLVNVYFDAEIPDFEWDMRGDGPTAVQHAVNRAEVEEAGRDAARLAESLIPDAFRDLDVVEWQIEEVNHAP